MSRALEQYAKAKTFTLPNPEHCSFTLGFSLIGLGNDGGLSTYPSWPQMMLEPLESTH